MRHLPEGPFAGLFEITRSRVSEEDIRDNCPSDPGYGGYVIYWQANLSSGELPEHYHGDLHEVVICLPYRLRSSVPEVLVPHYTASMVRFRNDALEAPRPGGEDRQI